MFLFFEAFQRHNFLPLFLFSIKISYPLMVKNTPNEIIIVYCELSLTFISVPVKDICLKVAYPDETSDYLTIDDFDDIQVILL